ncbi:hypothetical protein BC937DRAFT_87709, partial [Endogone sp. FLAS-F59071]
MKFGKALEQALEEMPAEWRSYAIQYKILKKCINHIVHELEDRNLSTELLTKWLRKTEGSDLQGEMIHKIDYFLQ